MALTIEEELDKIYQRGGNFSRQARRAYVRIEHLKSLLNECKLEFADLAIRHPDELNRDLYRSHLECLTEVLK